MGRLSKQHALRWSLVHPAVSPPLTQPRSNYGSTRCIEGFADDPWPVDVETDLAVVLGQLSKALSGLRHNGEVTLESYEQGIENSDPDHCRRDRRHHRIRPRQARNLNLKTPMRRPQTGPNTSEMNMQGDKWPYMPAWQSGVGC